MREQRSKTTAKPIVFASMSKSNFFWREHIVKYILESGGTPLSAFVMFSYFLLDTVDRYALIEANNDLVRLSDELWVFGIVSSGVRAEIEIAKAHNIPIRYFHIRRTEASLPAGKIDTLPLAERIEEIMEEFAEIEV